MNSIRHREPSAGFRRNTTRFVILKCQDTKGTKNELESVREKSKQTNKQKLNWLTEVTVITWTINNTMVVGVGKTGWVSKIK